MDTIVIDCASVRSEAEFWALYLAIVKPDGAEFFGRNLDAFWDAVSGGGPGWPGDRALRFINTSALESLREGRFLASLKTIAADSKSVRITLQA